MGWALLLFCPAIISQPKHFAQKNSSTQINLLGKVETSKTSKSCFFRIASSKEFYKKTHCGRNCERYCSRNHLFSEEQSPGATRGFLQKGEKSQRKHKNTFQNHTLFNNKCIRKAKPLWLKTNALFRYSWLIFQTEKKQRKDDYEYKNCECCPGHSLSVNH